MRNMGYRPITKLETQSDFKYFTDNIQVLWLKVMCGLTARDMTSDVQNAELPAFDSAYWGNVEITTSQTWTVPAGSRRLI